MNRNFNKLKFQFFNRKFNIFTKIYYIKCSKCVILYKNLKPSYFKHTFLCKFKNFFINI